MVQNLEKEYIGGCDILNFVNEIETLISENRYYTILLKILKKIFQMWKEN